MVKLVSKLVTKTSPIARNANLPSVRTRNIRKRNHRRHLLQGGNGAVNIEGEKVEAGRRRHLLNGANGEGS